MLRKILLIAISLCLSVAAVADEADVSRALEAFDRAPGATAANSFFAALDGEQFTDEEIRFSDRVPADSVRQQVWYWAAEWFYDRQDYQRARDYGEQALTLCRGASVVKADCRTCWAAPACA